MQKLKIELENCYGIKKLSEELDFSACRSVAIYAPNGTMKTSFAKTFQDIQDDVKPKDVMFPAREPVCNVTMENGLALDVELFVIHPYSETFESKKLTTLLLKKELRERYQNEYKKIEESETSFYEKLKWLSRLGTNDEVKGEILNSFNEVDIFSAVLSAESSVLDWKDPIYKEVIYSEIFNSKAFEFLKEQKDIIKEYIERYNQLVDWSKYLWKDFNHYKAKKLWDSLGKLSFFKWGHKIKFFDKTSSEFADDIVDLDSFNKKIKDEETVLFSDEKIGKILEKLDAKIKNAELERLRDYLFANKHLLKELQNPEFFRKRLWTDYFKEILQEYNDFVSKIKIGKIEIQKILEEANGDKAEWKKAIKEFENRFTVPFELEVENVADILTKQTEPKIDFIFKDEHTGERMSVWKGEILKVLSQGEKRALYLLNIIFEINARRHDKIKTLFVIDDIADSFDYKNKYAIVQYLKDISEEKDVDFFQIILTHNFDFFRTIQSRGIVTYNNCLASIKSGLEISLKKADWINNVFINDWRLNVASCNRKLLASVAFIRNIIEYTKGEEDGNYKTLTSLLHDKPDSETILVLELQRIFNETFYPHVSLPNQDTSVLNLLRREADAICVETSTGINLENKIVLSVAIRIISEKFLKSKITDTEFIDWLVNKKVQTGKLFVKYKTDFENNPLEEKNLETITEMMIMTPENIHLNSFMYEPIIDMSDDHLKKLYTKVKALA